MLPVNIFVEKPFFLYVPHAMPHVPLHVSDKFKGKSKQGLYGDVIMEIDWSAGQILAALKKHDLDKQTLVIYTSDNGPWLSYGNHAGSAGPLREGKMTTWEGGHREPCIMRWPVKFAQSRGQVVGAAIESWSGAADLADELAMRARWHVDLAHPGYVARMKQSPDKTDYQDAHLLAAVEDQGVAKTGQGAGEPAAVEQAEEH